MGRVPLTPHFSNPIEFTAFMQSALGGKSIPLFSHVTTLFNGIGHRENFSSPGATALNDRLAIFGPHPLAEAMGSFTADSAGLICTFHDSCNSLWYAVLLNFLRKVKGTFKHILCFVSRRKKIPAL